MVYDEKGTDIISNDKLVEFFCKFDAKDLLMDCFDKLIGKLKKKITFNVKLLNGLIHFLKDKTIFSACGFRRKQNYFFIEFYTKTNLNNKRVVMEIQNMYTAKNKYIINRIAIKNETEIDNEIIEWIIESYNLV